ncbi:hypothetical protein [Streptomyces sp. NPDC057336]
MVTAPERSSPTDDHSDLGIYRGTVLLGGQGARFPRAAWSSPGTASSSSS